MLHCFDFVSFQKAVEYLIGSASRPDPQLRYHRSRSQPRKKRQLTFLTQHVDSWEELKYWAPHENCEFLDSRVKGGSYFRQHLRHAGDPLRLSKEVWYERSRRSLSNPRFLVRDRDYDHGHDRALDHVLGLTEEDELYARARKTVHFRCPKTAPKKKVLTWLARELWVEEGTQNLLAARYLRLIAHPSLLPASALDARDSGQIGFLPKSMDPA